MKKFNNLKVGDVVYIDKQSSFGDAGEEKVTKITTQYYIKTGKPYKVIWFGNHRFNADTGLPLNPPTAYYMSHVVKTS